MFYSGFLFIFFYFARKKVIFLWDAVSITPASLAHILYVSKGNITALLRLLYTFMIRFL